MSIASLPSSEPLFSANAFDNTRITDDSALLHTAMTTGSTYKKWVFIILSILLGIIIVLLIQYYYKKYEEDQKKKFLLKKANSSLKKNEHHMDLTDTPIKTLTSYEQVKNIMKNNEDGKVMILFWSKQCGHCIQALPAYKDASVKVSALHKTKFYAIEASYMQNEEDGWISKNITGFPTFMIISDDGPAVPYNGPRSSVGFLDAINIY